MKILVLAFLALAATPAWGSYLEACDFTVSVQETATAPALDGTVDEQTRLVKVLIEAAADNGSHMPTACESREGMSQWLTVESDRVVEVGDFLVVEYFYVNSMGPEGVISSERWTVIEDRRGALVYNCAQTDRSLPFYQVEIRLPLDRPVFGSQLYNLYVTEDSELVVSETNVPVRFLSDHQGGMETHFLGSEAVLILTSEDTIGDRVYASGNLFVDHLDLTKPVRCQKHN